MVKALILLALCAALVLLIAAIALVRKALICVLRIESTPSVALWLLAAIVVVALVVGVGLLVGVRFKFTM